jgi:hypothetical protein
VGDITTVATGTTIVATGITIVAKGVDYYSSIMMGVDDIIMPVATILF